MALHALRQPTAPDSDRFRETLLSVMDRKDHPSYWRLMAPGATRDQLLIHYLQEWAVYVRDFPVFLARVHSRCPEPQVRRELAENLYEEETGGISGGGPHAELFLRMMDGLGFDRLNFEHVPLLSESRTYRDYLDNATERAHWLVGLAVATIFVEGSRNDRLEIGAGSVARAPRLAGPGPAPAPRRPGGPLSGSGGTAGDDPIMSDPLVLHHGLDPKFLELKRVHRKVEGSHRLSAWSAVLGHATSTAERAEVAAALEDALALWLAYRDGVGSAAGI